MYTEHNQAEKAVQRINRQIAATPLSAGLYELLGQAYRSQKNYPKAEEAYRKAISIDKNSVNAYSLLAQLFILQNSMDKAIPQLEKALAVNPKLAQTHVVMGNVYDAMKNTEKAKYHYSEALKIDPSLAVAANNLAWILCENGGNLDEALRLARSAKQNLPDVASVSDTLAWIYYKRKAYASAIDLLQECVKKEPQNATYQFHLGMSYYKNGDQRRAKESLAQAIKLDPNLPGIAEARSIISR
jgi:tetratricopeptide (TPR) repeat protein